MVDHRLLHGVAAFRRACEAFHRADGAAMHLRQEQQAGVQRPRAGFVRDHHGAGTAIAFVAAFLVPVSPRSSRSQSSRVRVAGCPVTVTGVPFR